MLALVRLKTTYTGCHSPLNNFVKTVLQASTPSPPPLLLQVHRGILASFVMSLSSNKQSQPKANWKPVWLAVENWLPTYLAPAWNICCVQFFASQGYWSEWAFRSAWAPWVYPSPNRCLQAECQRATVCSGFTVVISWHSLVCTKKRKSITFQQTFDTYSLC